MSDPLQIPDRMLRGLSATSRLKHPLPTPCPPPSPTHVFVQKSESPPARYPGCETNRAKSTITTITKKPIPENRAHLIEGTLSSGLTKPFKCGFYMYRNLKCLKVLLIWTKEEKWTDKRKSKDLRESNLQKVMERTDFLLSCSVGEHPNL